MAATHPVDLIHAAAEKNYTYQKRVKEKLEALTGQFDLDCWRSVNEAIADDAARAPKAKRRLERSVYDPHWLTVSRRSLRS